MYSKIEWNPFYNSFQIWNTCIIHSTNQWYLPHTTFCPKLSATAPFPTMIRKIHGRSAQGLPSTSTSILWKDSEHGRWQHGMYIVRNPFLFCITIRIARHVAGIEGSKLPPLEYFPKEDTDFEISIAHAPSALRLALVYPLSPCKRLPQTSSCYSHKTSLILEMYASYLKLETRTVFSYRQEASGTPIRSCLYSRAQNSPLTRI